MEAIKALRENTFSPLQIRKYKLYLIGIGVSHIGTWMQTVALGWLVLELTGSGTQLGSVLAFRFAPMLFISIFAGSVVDSFDKRRLLCIAQIAAALLAFSMSALIFTGSIEMWIVYLAASLFGIVDVVDRPARQSYVHEMVGPENLKNAVALGSAQANLARALGPLFAGILIATVGTAFCFFANALSFLVFFAALMLLQKRELHYELREKRKVDHVLSGISYVASVPLIRTILISMAIIGTLSYEFQTSLPLFAHTTFLGDAADYAALLSAMGAGSVAGGVFSFREEN